MRPILAAALLALGLAACGGREEQAAAPSPTPAGPVAPLTYVQRTDSAEVSLTLPQALTHAPALHAKLYADEKAGLDAFAAKAVDDLKGLVAAGFPARPYQRKVDYTLAAETPRLISLRRQAFEDTGGAHPNTALTGATWDKTAGKMLETKDLFAAGADMTAADTALCEAIKAEKRTRIGDDSFNSLFTACPKLLETRVTLSRSTVAGKAGGVTALFSPYDIGPYVEGAYEVDVPASALTGALKPDYAGEFGGAPAPRPAAG